MVGLYAGNAHLFPMPSMFLTGPAVASGIAWVNSLGILAGAINAPIMGWLKDSTGSFESGLYFLAGPVSLARLSLSSACERHPPSSRPAWCARRNERMDADNRTDYPKRRLGTGGAG